ncbi:MAG: hypothetical protein GXY46_01625 [Actinobacteria bacterium]|nr:hypothetical protein [Actinomycetota bacterium]
MFSGTGTWRKVGIVALAVVAGACFFGVGLILTGIIAEPETLIINVVRWILRK